MITDSKPASSQHSEMNKTLHYIYDKSSYHPYTRPFRINAFLSLEDVIRYVTAQHGQNSTSLLLTCNTETQRNLQSRLPASVNITILHIDTFFEEFVKLFQRQPPAMRLIMPALGEVLLRRAISSVHPGWQPAMFDSIRAGISKIKRNSLQQYQYIKAPQPGSDEPKRALIWDCHQFYSQLLRANYCYERDDLPLLVLKHLQQTPMQNTRYDQIVVCNVEHCTVAQLSVITHLLR